uniref:Uncharacterized protein n=1 Tax=Caenorhabditis japonica TaxID=281687 RepID=A0A8R1IKT1_CAEJA
MDAVVDFAKVLLGTLFFIVLNTLKNVLPNGILPRKSVQGKKVLITGAGSGIGRLMAVEFAKLGAELIIWDVSLDGANETKKQVEAAGGTGHVFHVDLSQYKEIHRVGKETKSDWRRGYSD